MWLVKSRCPRWNECCILIVAVTERNLQER